MWRDGIVTRMSSQRRCRSGMNRLMKWRTSDPTMVAAVMTTLSRWLSGVSYVDATERGDGATGDGGIPAGDSARTAVGGGAVTGAPFRSDLVAVTDEPRSEGVSRFYIRRRVTPAGL